VLLKVVSTTVEATMSGSVADYGRAEKAALATVYEDLLGCMPPGCQLSISVAEASASPSRQRRTSAGGVVVQAITEDRRPGAAPPPAITQAALAASLASSGVDTLASVQVSSIAPPVTTTQSVATIVPAPSPPLPPAAPPPVPSPPPPAPSCPRPLVPSASPPPFQSVSAGEEASLTSAADNGLLLWVGAGAVVSSLLTWAAWLVCRSRRRGAPSRSSTRARAPAAAPAAAAVAGGHAASGKVAERLARARQGKMPPELGSTGLPDGQEMPGQHLRV